MIPALWLAAALAALGYGIFYAGRAPGRAGPLLKTASTALLAVIAALAGAPGWIVLGLALGAAGDFALTHPGERAFLSGVAAFALGHLAYVAGFAGIGVQQSPGGGTLTAVALVLVLLGSAERWLAPWTGALRWPVFGYGLVIGLMAVAALLLPPGPGRAALLAGALLFVLSDLILALQQFRLAPASRPHLTAGLVLWPIYWSGQALILWGALQAGHALST